MISFKRFVENTDKLRSKGYRDIIFMHHCIDFILSRGMEILEIVQKQDNIEAKEFVKKGLTLIESFAKRLKDILEDTPVGETDIFVNIASFIKGDIPTRFENKYPGLRIPFYCMEYIQNALKFIHFEITKEKIDIYAIKQKLTDIIHDFMLANGDAQASTGIPSTLANQITANYTEPDNIQL